MKDQFSQFYIPSDEEFKKLWDECIFVLDTNVLHDLYRYSKKTREDMLNVLRALNDRLWIPYQVAQEFYENRPNVILSQTQSVDDAIDAIRQASSSAKKTITQVVREHHPHINKSDLINTIKTKLNEIVKDLEKQKIENAHSINDDEILNEVTKLFEGKVGTSCAHEELKAIYKDGKERYEKDIPPGYMDARPPNKKDGDKVYGDLVVWMQTIYYAKKTGKSIILITNDTKDDWWWNVKERTISPRPELIKEIKEKAGVDFYMYTSEIFMEKAPEYIGSDPSDDAVEEMRDVSQEDVLKRRSKVVAEMIKNRIMSGSTYGDLGARVTKDTLKNIYQYDFGAHILEEPHRCDYALAQEYIDAMADKHGYEISYIDMPPPNNMLISIKNGLHETHWNKMKSFSQKCGIKLHLVP